MIFKGFKFGMLLQLAIGPVCILIFQLATINGFFVAETGILGVVLIDGLFILCAILGISTLIKRENVKSGLKIFGALILLVFGLSMVVSIFNISILPNFGISGSSDIKSSFLRALILTSANPLTILFWSGIFSTKIIEEKMKQKDIYLYGFGALMSTLISLTLVAISGKLIKPLFSTTAQQVLNLVVGVILVFFSLKMVWKRG